MGVNTVTNKIYVENGGNAPYAGSGNLTVIDGATKSFVTVRDPNASQADYVAVDSVTNKIYLSNWSSNNVTVVDGATNSTITVTDPNARGPSRLDVNPTTNRIYVVNGDIWGGSNNVTVIDGAAKSPGVTLTPTSLTFPPQAIGTTSAPAGQEQAASERAGREPHPSALQPCTTRPILRLSTSFSWRRRYETC
jgi:DNA-binding beta-propeller fold protein YncE